MLFAGDAGGFVNAFTAEGIYYAMVSGELAGRAIAEVRGQAAAAGPVYDRLWRAEIGAELDDAVLIQRYLFSSHDAGRPRGPRRGGGAGPRRSAAGVRARANVSYRTLRRRMFCRVSRRPSGVSARERFGARLATAGAHD